MKIAYFAHLNGVGRSGVLHKIAGQVDAWRADGHDARVFVLTRDEDRAWESRLDHVVVRRYAGAVSRMRAVAELVHEIRRARPTVVYFRRDLLYPQTLLFPGDASLVVEINEDDLSEYALGSRVRAAYNARTRGIMLGRAKGLVFVTGELSEAPAFRGFPGRRAVVSNGIDLADYPWVPPAANPTPRLVFIGTAGQPWHGVDKLVMLARLRPDWQVDIIGMSGDGYDAPPNMAWHGPLDRSEAFPILAAADVGVGSLAMHRNQLNEACSLKVREYLAVGLPVLYGNIDRDADRLGALALRIANVETNVTDELSRITAFVEAARGARIPRSAVAHIDYRAKERERLALFEAVARD